MPSQYRVVHFVPNPLSDEKLNIGLVAWDSTSCEAQFLSDPRKLRAVASDRYQLLRDALKELRTLNHSQRAFELTGLSNMKLSDIQTMASKWDRHIQFSEPRGSLLACRELLEQVQAIHLPVVSTIQQTYQRTRVAKAFGLKQAISEIRSIFGENLKTDVGKYLKLAVELKGNSERHELDIGIVKGRPLAGIKAIKIRGASEKSFRTTVDAAAWAIWDIKRYDPDFSLAVFASPQADVNHQEAWRKASKIFRGLNAEVLSETTIGNWARKQTMNPALAAA